MPTFTRRTRTPVPPEALFTWHARPGAFERLAPPWQPVRLAEFEGTGAGQRAVIELGPGPRPLRWVAEHHPLPDEERQHGALGFVDEQVSGPFAAWRHTHRMLPAEDPGRSVLEDHVEYELPLAPIAYPLAGDRAERELLRLFAYRHRVTREDLARHAAADLSSLTVAITGSTGLLGSALAALLTTGGHTVVRLVRSTQQATAWRRGPRERAAYWNPARGEIDRAALEGVDAVVHLAGESVFAPRWSREKKARILDSRARGTRLLADTLATLKRPPRVLLSASASGYYGDSGDETVTEQAGPGEGFLAEVCRAWEAATAPAEQAGIRTCRLRIGVVLSPAGGFLGTAFPAFWLGLGGSVGSGRGWMPWVALDDVLYAVLHLLARDDLAGPFNLSAPHPVRQKDLTDDLGAVLRRPSVLRIPASLARTAGGEAAREMALKSVRMQPERLLNSGFRFAYPLLDGALRHLLGRTAIVPVDPTAPAA